jgi:hypothetical protein
MELMNPNIKAHPLSKFEYLSFSGEEHHSCQRLVNQQAREDISVTKAVNSSNLFSCDQLQLIVLVLNG